MARYTVRVSFEVHDDVSQTQVRDIVHQLASEPQIHTDSLHVMQVRRFPVRHCRTPGKARVKR
jgi:hypothetical protein